MKTVYQIWAKYRYHRIGQLAWSMHGIYETEIDAWNSAEEIRSSADVVEVKIIAVQEIMGD